MKPILIFCHNYINYNWEEIIREQLNKLISSDLYYKADEIYYGVYSHDKFQLFKFIELIQKFDVKNKIRIVIHPFNDGEKQTLILLQEIIKNYEDGYVLYYHTKGITSLKSHGDYFDYKNIESWRHIMEYFNIEKWRDALNEMDKGFDTYGILRVGEDATPPHKNYYAGNFWWGTIQYLKTLSNIKDGDNRMDVEMWIGNKGDSNWCNVFPLYGGDIYTEYYDPKDYIK